MDKNQTTSSRSGSLSGIPTAAGRLTVSLAKKDPGSDPYAAFARSSSSICRNSVKGLNAAGSDTRTPANTFQRVTHRLAGVAMEKVVQCVHIPEKVTQEVFKSRGQLLPSCMNGFYVSAG